jgi:hypothetical protein
MSEIVTEPTPMNTENPSLEEQMAQMEAADQATTQAPLGASIEQPEQVSDNSDQSQSDDTLIGGKFKSQEELLKAYESLQSKLGENEVTETTDSEEVKPEIDDLSLEKKEITSNDVIQKASQEFWDSGEIGEESYKALEDMGLSKDVVDQFAEAQKAKQQLQEYQAAELRNNAFNQVGGEDNYRAMGEWAASNLNDGELLAYNENVNSGDPNKINLAVSALYSRYSKSNTISPQNQLSGMSATTGVTPFQSDAQQREAQRDPRYASDPAYRQSVDARIAASL